MSSLPHDLISTAEAARILGVTPRAVRAWIVAGKLTGWRVGSVWRTSGESVRKFARPSVASGKDAAIAIRAGERHKDAMARLAKRGIT